MVRLYLREELHCLGNPNVPAVLRWQNLMSKAKEYNHLPFPLLSSKEQSLSKQSKDLSQNQKRTAKLPPWRKDSIQA